MNKRYLILAVALFVAIASIYVLIPSKLKVASYTLAAEPSGSVNRILETPQTIKKWWPGKSISDSVFQFQQTDYFFTNWNPLNVSFNCVVDGKKYKATINTISIKVDTTAIQIEYEAFNAGINPIERINSFFVAKKLKEQIDQVLNEAKKASNKMETVYGVEIVAAKVKDSSLISTKKTFPSMPSNQEIHDLIQILKNHINENGGVEKDYPMLNVHQTIDHKYEAMVAIPLEKDIVSKGSIVVKKMILGNILEAKIQGGFQKIHLGEKALKNYADDFSKKSPAIPFQLLVTDRYTESDSSKWITILKYPVF